MRIIYTGPPALAELLVADVEAEGFSVTMEGRLTESRGLPDVETIVIFVTVATGGGFLAKAGSDAFDAMRAAVERAVSKLRSRRSDVNVEIDDA